MKWSIPERFVKQGRQYVDEGRVLNLSLDEHMGNWLAEVLDDERYQVVLDGSPKEQDRCTCSEWSSKGYCKHTVAVELYLRDIGYNRIMKQNMSLEKVQKAPNVSESLLSQISHLNEKKYQEVHKPVEVEFLIENLEKVIWNREKSIPIISLRIGFVGDKKYVVKDLSQFLEDFVKGNVYETSTQAYYLNEQTLSSQEMGQLLDLWEMKNQQHLSLNGQAGITLPNKSLLLDGGVLKKWLSSTLEDTKHLFWLVEGKKQKIQGFYANWLPYKGTVIETQDHLHVTLTPNYLYYYPESRLCYSEGFVGEVHGDEMSYVTLLEDNLKRVAEGQLLFPMHQLQTFINDFYPVLKKVATLQIGESLAKRLVEEPLVSKLMLCLVNKKIKASPVFTYGEWGCNGYLGQIDTQESDKLIQRDSYQEKYLLAELADFGYLVEGESSWKKLPKEENLYHFFTVELPKLRATFSEVMVSNELQELFLEGLKYQPTLQVELNQSWLDIQFDISGISEDEINGVIQSLYKGRSFHVLDNGQLLSLETEEYKQISENLKDLQSKPIVQQGSLRLPKYQSIALAQKLEKGKGVSITADFEKMIQDLQNFETLEIPLPITFQGELRPYQEVGFRWLMMLKSYGFGGILADEMGLGKTIQAIAYLLKEKEEGNTQPSLIITPASLIYNWKKEIERFAPSLNVVLVNGDTESRKEILGDLAGVDVIITSYGTYRQDEVSYKETDFHTLFFDEAQMAKNTNTKTFQAIKKVKATHRFALSGTPIENRIDEIWSLFHLIMPELLPSFKKFQQLDKEEINHLIRPFILRRTKSEVLTELPEKIETTIYSDLTPDQKAIYLAQLQEIQTNMADLTGKDFQKQRFSILAGLTRLRQICCSPKLFIPEYEGDSGKLNLLRELLEAALASGKRILLFSQFTSMLTIIEEMITELGMESFFLRGSTPPIQRQKMVDEFNEGEKDIFLISLKAGGTGLNLTGADTVILYDLWWNPAVEEQAAGRAHRMGQEKEVEVWRLVAEGTIEEKIVQLQEEKKSLFEDILGNSSSQLTESDIRKLLLDE